MTKIGKRHFTERNPGRSDLTPVALITCFSTIKSGISKKGGGVGKGGVPEILRNFEKCGKMEMKNSGNLKICRKIVFFWKSWKFRSNFLIFSEILKKREIYIDFFIEKRRFW